jgi:hypothetical protein
MGTLRPKLSELAKGLTLDNEDVHKIIIPKLTADVLEMEDIHFHFDSAVVLPWRYGENTELSPDEQRISALSVIAAALRYAKANSGRKLLVAGHTDSSGGADYNRKLSKTRAEATQALLKGDKDAWGKACAEHQKIEDLQMTLKWVAEVHGWPCNPGAVDNEVGPRTRAARRAFRKRYNDELSGSLALDADTSAADWRAFLDLYEISLTDELGDDLKAGRNALTFYDPSILACGEDFAQETNTPAGMRSVSDRRVDLLFLDPGQDYPSFFKEKPPGNSIYGPFPWVFRNYLPVDPPVQLSLSLTAIEGLYKPGFVADGDVAPKASGYQVGYLSDDGLGRIFVNHKPRTDPTQAWDAVTVKDTQYIELCAQVTVVQGQIPPDARVEWEWFDPNDAAHPETQSHAARQPDEVDADGKSRSMLNRGTSDYPSPSSKDMARFAQAGDFGFADGATKNLSDTQVKNGESRVRLHVSNIAGDSFVVQARMKNSPRITPSGQKQTGVMTMWKRIDVEYVRMAGAFKLPIEKVPPFFEPARVQMDFAPERVVASKPFLTTLDRKKEAACSDYASASKGEFAAENKPGWFFLASAERAASEFFSMRGASGTGISNVSYVGKARVEVVSSQGQSWEKLIVDEAITGKVSFMKVQDSDGGPHGYMGVWKKEVIGGQTHLHLQGIDYQSDFAVPTGMTTGLLGGPGQGGAYDKSDTYFLRNRARSPSGAWEPGGMGFDEQVFIHAVPPGSVETAGLSPSARYEGREYFAGRLLVFTRAFAATSLDEEKAVRVIVHEFTHAFGYPHKCGYYGWPQPPSYTCAMNYFLTWLYEIGTRKLQRFVYGDPGGNLCSKHLSGVREVHLEDNPAIWTW